MPRKESVGPELVAFAGVVVDDVQDDFDACRMERLHHHFEFAQRAGRGVAHLGREEADAVIAPVVAQTELDEPLVVDEGVSAGGRSR